MASQVIEGLTADLDQLVIPIGDVALDIDSLGVRTGQVRIGVGASQLGGITLSGIIGGGSVSSVNGQTGAVVLDLANLASWDGVTAAAAGDLPFFNGSQYTPRAITLGDISEIVTTGVQNGDTLVWNAVNRRFEPGTAVGGEADNMGDHTATTNLLMQNFAIDEASALNFALGWSVESPNDQSISIQRQGVTKFAMTNQGTAGVGFLVLGDYGAIRASDAAFGSPTNLAHFSASGAMLKTNLSDVDVSSFAQIDLAGIATGQTVVWDGTNLVPGTASGGGATIISDLTDVITLGVQDGQALRWNAAQSRFEPGADTFSGNFADLAEFAALTPLAGQTPVFDGTNWGFGTVTTPDLGSLTNVTLTGLQDGDALTYFAGTGTWAPRRALVTDFDTSAPAAGDMMYFTGSVWSRVQAGTNGQVLTLVGGVPTWS